MRTNISRKHLTKRISFSFFCALMSWCPLSPVNASELDSTPHQHTWSTDYYQQTRESALKGFAASQYELGLMFEYGKGADQNDIKAALWYEKSAAQGNSNAQYRLAVLIDNGWGHPVDKSKAFNLYRAAAERGHELAQHDLAIMYFEGAGVDRDVVQAYKWLKIANLSGNQLMHKHLYMVSREMSSDQIEAAESLAKNWVGYPGI